MRRKILIGAIITVGVVVAAALALLLYLNFADLGELHRATVERLLTDALGREVRIAGGLDVDFGFDPRVDARDLSLANPEWSADLSMVSIDHLVLEVNLASLVFKPIRIHVLEINGAEVLLESTEDGKANWVFETAAREEPREPSGPLRLSVGRVGLRGSRLVVRTPDLDRPLNLLLDRLDVESDASDMLELQLAGSLNDADLELGGRLGTLAELLALGNVSHDLAGQLGKLSITLAGEIGELATLRKADVDLSIDAPVMDEITNLVGLPSLGEGPFHVAAATAPSGEVSTLSFDGTLGEVTVTASGTVDAILSPSHLDLEFRTSGPRLAAVMALAGIEGAAQKPFEASGSLRWKGFPITFEGVEGRVGDNTVSLDGTLGEPPRMLGTDFRFAAEGPDISAIALLANLNLPADAFEIDGRLVRVDTGVSIQGVAAKVGQMSASVDGMVGDPPQFGGTDLQIEAQGPSLAPLTGLAGTTLPDLPFTVAGRLLPEENAVVLEGVRASLGSNSARIEGTVATGAGFTGTDLRVVAEGPDLAWLEAPTGFTDLPRAPYRIEGGVVVEDDGYRLRDVSARIADTTARVDGRVGPLPQLSGTNVTVQAEGPDVSIPLSLAGIAGVPASPYRISGGVKKAGDWIELDGMEATLGVGRITVDGRIATAEGAAGSRLTVDGSGPDASVFDSVLGDTELPPDPYSFSGAVQLQPDGVFFEGAVADFGWGRLEADGLLSREDAFAGTDVAFTVSAPDLSRVGAIVNTSGLVDLPPLPAKPLAVSGRTALDAEGYELSDLIFTLGEASANITGRVGAPPRFRGTDLTFQADGPDASLFSALTGVTVPVAPFRANGRIENPTQGFRFHEVSLQLGEYWVTADGVVGDPPQLIGTDIDVDAKGPSLVLFSDLFGLSPFPDQPFSLEGSFDGNPRRFKSERFAVTLGSSDLGGWFRVALEGKPELSGEFHSNRIDLREILPEPEAKKPTEQKPTSDRSTRFSDEPFNLPWLDAAEGTVTVSIGDFQGRATHLTDLSSSVVLRDGRLEVDPINAVGTYGGVLSGRLLLESVGDQHRLATNVQLNQARIDFSTVDDDPEEWPVFDFLVEYDGTGVSPHRMMSAANGRFSIIVGPGVMERSVVNLIATDILAGVLDALNPFSGKQTTTNLECGVIVVNLEQGVATLDPFAIQTQQLTILGDGKVDFSTEKLSADWVAKPRKGIGVSASLITNPYVKLTGTLTNPEIGLKPIEAAASTGLAVATGGLSLLGKGLLDRVTAEQKVCEKAIKRAEKQLAKKQAGNPK